MMDKKCSICDKEIDIQYDEFGRVVWDQGHNAQPINDGRCCSACNSAVVLTERLKRVYCGWRSV